MTAEVETEVLIAGGGMVGLSLAVALADAGLAVMVVDRLDPAAMKEEAFDGRSSAIARGSQQALSVLGLWPGMAEAASPILDIRISDGHPSGRNGGSERRGGASSLFLHFSHRDTEEGPAADKGIPPDIPPDIPPGIPLGHIVENTAIRRACLARVKTLPKLDLRAPAELASVARSAAGVKAVLGDGTTVSARLLVAADGRGSAQRRAAGIAVTEVGYGQTGIVATVMHERPHNGVAHEHFLPSGPFALLPMTDAEDAEGRIVHRSSLVWTERTNLVPAMLALDDKGFAAELQRRFGDSLGQLALWSARRWSYPLSLLHAERYIDQRLALVGDAAHGIHPIAGQGLNLGLRDVAALAESIVDARRLGLDIGSPSVLQRYQRWRRFDNMALIVATDSLNRLFSSDLPPLRLLRDLGLAAVNRLPPMKRFFMRHAMGLVGELPRLVKGEAL
ncbi:UbiH/UbiF/VisC/COQ6 family ubiquinone biosynthesis hydroxylase [Pelagibius sp.]|uniref:UbiH/UbiF/VisC/COQ6 family ubiquinone biosynthesis hydroxylase n=1 Tax=Pelagibius sp. TaxID=1931238 RepID=UPI003BAEF1B5